jgi:hypothetical protein
MQPSLVAEIESAPPTLLKQWDCAHGHSPETMLDSGCRREFEEEGLRVRKDGSTFFMAEIVITALHDEHGKRVFQGRLPGAARLDIVKESHEAEIHV